MAIDIQHQPEQQRFEATLDGHRGANEYRIDGGVMTIIHTEVAAELEGKGVAGALTQAALDYAKARGLKVKAVCSYARGYMQRHPETLELKA